MTVKTVIVLLVLLVLLGVISIGEAVFFAFAAMVLIDHP